MNKSLILILCCFFGILALEPVIATNQAYNVLVTGEYVQSTAKCICGSGIYQFKTSAFYNYCPQCHEHGTLIFNIGPGSPEGNWRCKSCGCDYCPQCGKECIEGSHLSLIKYTNRTTSDYLEIPPEQPDPETDNLDLPPGEMMIDDHANMDHTMVDQSGSSAFSNSELVNLHGRRGLETLADYIGKHFNHSLGAATTAEGVMVTGMGDCWGLSDYAKNVLVANGYRVRLVQGRTTEASNHRWLEVQLEDGSWTIFDPSMVTKKYGYKPYWTRCGVKTAVLGVYT